jgi:hypothetical protein
MPSLTSTIASSLTASSSSFNTFVSTLLNVEILRTRLTLVRLEYAATALRAGWVDGPGAIGLLGEE